MWPDYNFSTSTCRQNHTYFDSSEYLRSAYHCTAFFNLPLNLLTFYVIIWKTPERMRNMRTPLLISHILCTNLDIMINILCGPYAFFPSASGLTLGLLGDLGVPMKWQCYWCQVSVLMIGVSTIISYENRQNQIITISFKIKSSKTRVVYFGLNFLFALVIMIPFFLDNKDQGYLRRKVLDKIPCPTIEFFDDKTYVLLEGGEVLPAVSIMGSTFVISFQAFFFILHTVYHLSVISNASISAATRSLQRRYLFYVTIQVTIPMLGLVFPVGMSMYAYHMNYYNQAFNNQAMLIMANHGLLSSLSTLMIYKPYRDFCVEIVTLCSKKRGERRVSTTMEVLPKNTTSDSKVESEKN